MLLKEIVNEDYIARKAERHLKSVIGNNETNEISKRLIAKGIDPTPSNIEFYLKLFSKSEKWTITSRAHNVVALWTEERFNEFTIVRGMAVK